jgi:hypothetical protein
MKITIDLPESFAFTFPGAAGGSTIQLATAEFPAHILAEAVRHGIQQKGADCISDAKKRGLTETAAMDEVLESIANLKAGTWNMKGGPRINTLDDYIAREAKKAAKDWMEKNPSKATESLEHYTGKAKQNAALRAAWESAWDKIVEERKAKAQAGSTDLDDVFS